MALSSNLNLRLGIDVSNLSRELGKVEKSLSRFGGQMESIGSKMTQSFTLPIIALGGAALKSFADLEKLQNGLTAIMGSSDAAAQELEKLRKVAENPGLALPQVVQASSSLQSVGMSADAARETITQFGNAVARSGGGAEQFSGVVLALSQISAVGKVTQEDLNQIKERLPEFSRVMKEEFGTTTAESIRAMGISSEEFIKRSVGALGNLERANGGLANTFDNLKDNVTASLGELGKTINQSLNLEEVAARLSAAIQGLVNGFKSLNPETQSFIVKAALIVAAIGPVIFIIGKIVSGIGALVGAFNMVVKAVKAVNTAFAFLAANPIILGIVAAIAAIGAIALYVYDNWKAFKDLFSNLWIDIKNIVYNGINAILSGVDKVQKALGLKIFKDETLKPYVKEQRIVAAEFKTIGETVDSLKGKLSSLFTSGAKPTSDGGGAIVSPDTPKKTTGGVGLDTDAINKALKERIALNEENLSKINIGAKSAEHILFVALSNYDKAMAFNGMDGMLKTLDLYPAKLESTSTATKKLKENTEALAAAQKLAGDGVSQTSEKMSALLTMNEQLSKGLTDLINNTLGDLAGAFGEELGNALSGAKFQMQNLLIPIANAIISFGKLAIQAGITALALKKALTLGQAAAAIAAGIALVALGTVIKNGAAVPKLAQGGLAYSPTMAMVGDNKNARVDPEVIAPLSKLKSMMGDMGVGGTLETRISGNDLIILLNRSQKGLSRVQ